MNKDTKVVILVGICCLLFLVCIFGLTRLNKNTQKENSNQSSSVETSYEDNDTDDIDYVNSNNEESVPELLDEDDFNNSQSSNPEEDSTEEASDINTDDINNIDESHNLDIELKDQDSIENVTASTQEGIFKYNETYQVIDMIRGEHSLYLIEKCTYDYDNSVSYELYRDDGTTWGIIEDKDKVYYENSKMSLDEYKEYAAQVAETDNLYSDNINYVELVYYPEYSEIINTSESMILLQ